MKFGTLESIAHNIAASMADGVGLMVGYYEIEVFLEARRSREGYIDVDFLTGRTSGGAPSSYLAAAARAYASVLPTFLEKHVVATTDFRQLRSRYFGGGYFVVTIEDRHRRVLAREYDYYGRRPRIRDASGRIRRINNRVQPPAPSDPSWPAIESRATEVRDPAMDDLRGLHDWRLVSILFDWKQARVTLILRPLKVPGYERVDECRLVADGVVNLHVPQRSEWGPSEHVNDVRGPVDAWAGNQELRIEMQSGDTVTIVAASFALSKVEAG